jgi:hypothetical protein
VTLLVRRTGAWQPATPTIGVAGAGPATIDRLFVRDGDRWRGITPNIPGGGQAAVDPVAVYLTSAGQVRTSGGAVTGDLTIIARVAAADWTPAAIQTIAAKWGTSGNYGFQLQLLTGGTFRLSWSTNGTAVTTKDSAVHRLDNLHPYWVKVDLDVDDGAGNRVVTFSTADGDSAAPPTTWTVLSTHTDAGTTSIFNTGAVLEVGSTNGTDNRLTGAVWRTIIQAGGITVADFDASLLVRSGAVAYTDTLGNTWTYLGVEQWAARLTWSATPGCTYQMHTADVDPTTGEQGPWGAAAAADIHHPIGYAVRTLDGVDVAWTTDTAMAGTGLDVRWAGQVAADGTLVAQDSGVAASGRAFRLGTVTRAMLAAGAATGPARYRPTLASHNLTTADPLGAVTGLDVRVALTMTDWTPPSVRHLISQFSTTTTNDAWSLGLTTDGRLFVLLSTDGTNSTYIVTDAPVPFGNDGTAAVRFTWATTIRQAGDSPGGVRIWYRPAAAATAKADTEPHTDWTEMPIAAPAGPTGALHNSTAALSILSEASSTAAAIEGTAFYASVAVDVGVAPTVVMDPVFGQPAADPSSFRSSSGHTWSRSGSPLLVVGPERTIRFDESPGNGYLDVASGFTSGGVDGRLTIPDPFGALTNLDIRWVGSLNDWTPAAASVLIAQDLGSGANRAWALQVNTAGTLSLLTTTGGSTMTTATSDSGPPVSDGAVIAIKVTWRSSDGQIQFFYKVVTIETAAVAAATHTGWTQIGANKVGVTGALYNSTAVVSTLAFSGGASPVNGTVHYASVASTIDAAATIVFDPRDGGLGSGVTSYTASTGQTVTIAGGITFAAALPSWGNAPVDLTTSGWWCIRGDWRSSDGRKRVLVKATTIDTADTDTDDDTGWTQVGGDLVGHTRPLVDTARKITVGNIDAATTGVAAPSHATHLYASVAAAVDGTPVVVFDPVASYRTGTTWMSSTLHTWTCTVGELVAVADSTRPAVTVTGLSGGTRTLIEARAVNSAGVGDWVGGEVAVP